MRSFLMVVIYRKERKIMKRNNCNIQIQKKQGIGGITMRYFKKIGALAMATALTVTLFTPGIEASALTKKQYGLTLSGDSSLSKNAGSAWGSVSPKSYVSVRSTYKYKTASGTVKTVDTDRTGAGGSSSASWNFTLPGTCKSYKLVTKWSGLYLDNPEVTMKQTLEV